MNNISNTKFNERLWRRIAIIAGIFSFIICVLLIANYIQSKSYDPVNSNVISSLVDRLNQNPGDDKLREEIRALDLLARKAYFTNQWQIRMGGLMLLAGLAVVIIALQLISLNRKKQPLVEGEFSENVTLLQKNARRWITVGGIGIVVLALIFGFLSHNDLSKKLSLSASVAGGETQAAQSPDVALTDSGSVTMTSADTATTDTTSAVTDELNSKDNHPNFRGPGGNGRIPQKNIPVSWNGASGKNILWKTAIPLPGFNSPVIWGSKIFLTGASNAKREVYCVDKNTGKILWTTAVEGVKGSIAPKVSAETGYAASTAATDGKGVYAIFPNGDIVGLDMDGKKVWAKNLGDPQNHYGHSSSLIVYRDKIIVQFDQRNSPKLMALSVKDGSTVWSTNRQVKISWASPIIVNTGKRMEIILAAEPFVAGYNPDNGKELWKIDCISGEVGASVAYANGIAYSVNEYSKLAAVKVGDNPELLWESDEYLSDIPSPVATDKYLFLATSYGVLACYDAQNGTKYWEKEMGTDVFSSPVIADGKLFVLDKNGIMHIIKIDKEYVSLAQNTLGEKSVCTPAFTNGHIYLRGDKNLYCIGSK
jgi:outer membrane protein assembly factor BamB